MQIEGYHMRLGGFSPEPGCVEGVLVVLVFGFYCPYFHASAVGGLGIEFGRVGGTSKSQIPHIVHTLGASSWLHISQHVQYARG